MFDDDVFYGLEIPEDLIEVDESVMDWIRGQAAEDNYDEE